jgi:hypothetical protein
MNAHNNENDPFEEVFRDRFADFESEPDNQLWQKIEPKLPVDSTRKFPYWQISAVVSLLLAGLWTYYATKSDDSQTENLTPLLSESPQTTNEVLKPKLSVKTTGTHSQTTTGDEVITKLEDNKTRDANHGSRPFEGRLPYSRTTPNNALIVNDLEKNTTKNVSVKSEDKMDIAKLSNRSLQEDNEASVLLKKGKYITEVDENKNKNSSLFSNPNTTIETSTTSLNKINENDFLNNDNKLNLSPVNNSNEKQENQSNNSSVLSVFSNKESILVLNKNVLTTLELKNYSLLKNHFKTPRLKFVVAPKKDEYFKERKPLEIYASVMPLLNYYTITPNGNNANYVHSIAVNNDDDRLGFYTQAGAIFTLSERFKLRTGLTFTRTNHSINYQIRTDSLIVQPSDKQGVDVSFEEKKANYSQIANYLGTKIEVQYIFLEGEALSHYLNVGLEGAYRLNGEKQFNGFANFAYGVTRRIGDKAYLFVEPTFSYSLNQQSDNNSFLLVKPNKIGFNIGVNFKIK